MAIQIPAFTTDQPYPFLVLRKMMAAFASVGVVNPSTDFVVSPSSGLQVQVTAGSAFVAQTVNTEGSSAYNGLYFVVNDATANPYNTISAPITNPRIDQVILRVYDVLEQGLGGSSKAQLEWLVGTESASASLATMGPGLSNPGASSLPANSLSLVYVLQTVGESSISSGNIVNANAGWTLCTLTTNWTNSFGGITPAVKISGGRLFFQGSATNNTGSSVTNATICTLPAGFAPTATRSAAVGLDNGGSSALPMRVSPGGHCIVEAPVPNGQAVTLDGYSVPL